MLVALLMAMTLTSPSFDAGGDIPRRHTCDGEGVSPALAWSDVPKGARTLALIVDDPDAPDPAAPKMTFVHWVVYDIPATATGLEEGASGPSLPMDVRFGLNGWGRSAYGGPCPPVGRHRYFFKLYALDTELGRAGRPISTKAELERAMRGHVLGEAQLVGKYQKAR